ncbi:MAG: MATE family efflux transporter [Pseudomonadota bacterium]|nr:MATE family efflux transporter [Pseudomonadota bacterium]
MTIAATTATGPAPAMPPARARLLTAPIWPTLFRLAAPAIVAMAIQSLMSIVETSYLGQLGRTELAGVALVFPLFMLAGMLSAGAIGGAVSGATAQAVGAGDQPRAEAILRTAIVLSVVLGLVMGFGIWAFDTAIFGALGGTGEVLAAGQAYADVLMPGLVAIWLFNMMSGVLRGAGDMLRPALLQALVTASHFILAPVLIIGAGGIGGNGIQGAAMAIVGAYGIGVLATLVLVLSGRATVSLRAGPVPATVVTPLLRVGTVAGIQAVFTVVTALWITGLVGRLGPAWLAGYGIGARLEFLMIPIIFGFGAAMIAMVGANAGAGNRARAIAVAWRGALAASVVVGLIGLGNAAFPTAWASLFTDDPAVIAATATYMGIVAPCYAFFALGLALYFASQGLKTLTMALAGSVARFVIIVVGTMVLSGAGTPDAEAAFGCVAFAMVSYGLIVSLGLRFGSWRK